MLHKLDALFSRPVCRLGLGALLSVLTLLIFLYPAHLTNQSHPVESMYVFSNLPLFGALFFVWFAVLLSLALSKGSEKTRNLENVVLVAIFTLVFSGIWVSLRGSYAGEASRDASNIAYINLHGFLPLAGNLYRHDFPGMAILGSMVSQVSGLVDFDVLAVLQLLYILVFPIVLYVVFRKVLDDLRWATIGTLLTITGSIMVDKQLFIFHPSSFAIFFLFTPFVLLLTHERSRGFGTVPSVLLLLIFMVALTATHFVTSGVLILVLLGVYLLQRFNRKTLVTITTICLCLTLLLVWEMYHAGSNFAGMSGLVPRMVEDFRQGIFMSGYAAGLAGSYTSETSPLWVNLTRYLWVVLLLVFAAILAVRNVLRARRLSETEVWITGGLLGIGLLTVIGIIASGMNEGYRVLVYAPFFSAPLVVLFFHKLRAPLRQYAGAALACLLVGLVFPTFLAHNNTVGTTAYYSYEFDGYEWLREQYGNKSDVYLAGGKAPLDYYFEPPIVHYVGASLQFAPEQSIAGMLADKLNSIDTLEKMSRLYDSMYIFEAGEETAQFEHLLDFNPVNSPEWQGFLQRLNQQNRIYDNGYMQFYKFGSG